jgi:hypothetical protein
LPPGDYAFVVVSLSGASPFRAVVNCSDQQTVVSAAPSIEHGTVIRDIDMPSLEKKIGNQLRALYEGASKK